MSNPSAIVANCENCGEVVHRVLKGKISNRHDYVFQGVVKCQKCGIVRNFTLRELKPIKVPIILSWMARSEKEEIDVSPQQVLNVGDIIELPSGNITITAIESKGRRVQSSKGNDIDTIWAKRVDKVRVKVTLAKRGKTLSRELFATPDEELCVGDLLEFAHETAVIQHIKIEERTLHKGCAMAIEIKRVYAKAVKVKQSY